MSAALLETYNRSRRDRGTCTLCGGAMSCTQDGLYLMRSCARRCASEREAITAAALDNARFRVLLAYNTDELARWGRP